MNNKKDLNKNIFNILKIGNNYKLYTSNIGYIIIPKIGKYIYKVFDDINFYNKELTSYKLLKQNNILIPKFEDLGNIEEYFILKLENIRKDFKRKESLDKLGLGKVAKLLNYLHLIKKENKNFLLGDIHESNFFEKKIGNDIKLGIFDFSSSYFGNDIENDICNLYIDIDLDKKLFKIFLDNYRLNIDFNKLYKYTIKELYERINNGMNLGMEHKKKYYSFLLKLKNNKGIKT